MGELDWVLDGDGKIVDRGRMVGDMKGTMNMNGR